jgi:hypothetical protein
VAAVKPRQLPRAKERLATVPVCRSVARHRRCNYLLKAVILPCPILSAPSSSKR